MQAVALCDGDVRLFVCLLVCLSPETLRPRYGRHQGCPTFSLPAQNSPSCRRGAATTTGEKNPWNLCLWRGLTRRLHKCATLVCCVSLILYVCTNSFNCIPYFSNFARDRWGPSVCQVFFVQIVNMQVMRFSSSGGPVGLVFWDQISHGSLEGIYQFSIEQNKNVFKLP